MLGLLPRGLQSAQVDDALDARSLGSSAEVPGGPPVALGKVRAGGHGVHQVVGDLHSGEGCLQRVRLQRIRGDALDLVPASPAERLRVA